MQRSTFTRSQNARLYCHDVACDEPAEPPYAAGAAWSRLFFKVGRDGHVAVSQLHPAQKLRKPDDIAKLVVLDTWLRNKDRFGGDDGDPFGVVNYDNVLLKPDKRMVELLAIDHSHALVETTLDDELDQAWVDEQVVYGRFRQFDHFLTRKTLGSALAAVERIDRTTLRRVCEGVPGAWGMTDGLSERLLTCLDERAQRLGSWLPAAIFDQYELQLD